MRKILLAGPGRVVINVGRVSSIGAAGLGALVALRVRAEKQHTALQLADVPTSILGSVQKTGRRNRGAGGDAAPGRCHSCIRRCPL
jgi:anti-anti-sigma regulatory factor